MHVAKARSSFRFALQIRGSEIDCEKLKVDAFPASAEGSLAGRRPIGSPTSTGSKKGEIALEQKFAHA